MMRHRRLGLLAYRMKAADAVPSHRPVRPVTGSLLSVVKATVLLLSRDQDEEAPPLRTYRNTLPGTPPAPTSVVHSEVEASNTKPYGEKLLEDPESGMPDNAVRATEPRSASPTPGTPPLPTAYRPRAPALPSTMDAYRSPSYTAKPRTDKELVAALADMEARPVTAMPPVPTLLLPPSTSSVSRSVPAAAPAKMSPSA